VKISAVKKLFVGSPLATAQARHERLGKASGLAIFASDPLSSNAYATEEILHVLILAGAVALSYSLPIAVGIAALILIVISSYRQTIRAYPQGGGAYIVAKDNLGVFPSLIAGAALLTDYVLTVAVSVAAGIAALTSAMPELLPYRIALCVLVVIGITVANLRGVRESGRLFALPTYFFVISILVMVAYGVVGIAFGWLREAPYEPHPPGLEGVGVFLLLRAFAAGCTALTGIEAVSDGVPAFRPPEAHNARIVMAWLGAMTVLMFLGITYLANHFGIVPGGDETVVSKIARHVFGSGLFYFEIQAVTMLILLLAANTSYADFPRLSFFMARDGFMPRQFSSQGDRLVFSNGILILAGLAILLLIGFQGDTHSLLPLYAIGVFISFTVSQSGMVRRWLRLREEGWWWRIWFNAVGATVTGLVMLTLAVTKFTEGAWIVVALVPMLVGGLLMVRRHYQQVAAQLSLEHFESSSIRNTTLVLVGDLHRGVVQALQYAKAISADARAVYVEVDPEKTRKLEEKWVKWGMGVPLVVLNSPYRSLLPPFLEYLDSLLALGEDQMVTIVIPEFIPAKWWQQLLHNQTALLIKGALLFRRNVVVTDVPYHLRR
jgi:amino acid transporter